MGQAMHGLTQELLRIHTDEIEQLQRSHRIAECSLDRQIDVGRLSHTLLDKTDRVIVKRDQEVIEDKTRTILRSHWLLPEGLAQGPGLLESRLAGVDSGRHFNQLHELCGQAEVHANEAIRTPRPPRDLGDRNRRCIAREDRVLPTDRVQLAEQIVLDLKTLEHGLDHEVTIGEICQLRRTRPLRHDRGKRISGQFSPCDRFSKKSLGLLTRPHQRVLPQIKHLGTKACSRCDDRDPGAHRAATSDPDRFNFTH